MKPTFRSTLLKSLVAVLLSYGSFAADAINPAQALDEVTIMGKRSQLEETRRQFNKVQDRLFARYNQLNRNPV